MSSPAPLDLKMTSAEYLVWERQQTDRHEFYDGEVFSQAGGTRRHSLIGTNTSRGIGNLLEERDCIVHGSDMRIHIKATDYYVYPDASVVCPPIEGGSDDVISNPVLIVEVLSPSTEDYDRGTKFNHYRKIPSLQEYIVVSQNEPHVEHHQKTESDLWQLRDVVGLEDSLELISIGATLSMKEIYAKVDFDESAS